MLATVDEGHRDLLAEALDQRRVVVDRDLGVRLPQVGADPRDDLPLTVTGKVQKGRLRGLERRRTMGLLE